jgi:hypothetical protein
MQATGEPMTESTATEVQQLIAEGRAAALAGDTFTARARFRRATELDSENPEAWLGLSSVVPILAEKRDYLQRVLALDPTNTEAADSLAYVEKLIAEGLQIAPHTVARNNTQAVMPRRCSPPRNRRPQPSMWHTATSTPTAKPVCAASSATARSAARARR